MLHPVKKMLQIISLFDLVQDQVLEISENIYNSLLWSRRKAQSWMSGLNIIFCGCLQFLMYLEWFASCSGFLVGEACNLMVMFDLRDVCNLLKHLRNCESSCLCFPIRVSIIPSGAWKSFPLLPTLLKTAFSVKDMCHYTKFTNIKNLRDRTGVFFL
jgi:hypothetical protein